MMDVAFMDWAWRAIVVLAVTLATAGAAIGIAIHRTEPEPEPEELVRTPTMIWFVNGRTMRTIDFGEEPEYSPLRGSDGERAVAEAERLLGVRP